MIPVVDPNLANGIPESSPVCHFLIRKPDETSGLGTTVLYFHDPKLHFDGPRVSLIA